MLQSCVRLVVQGWWAFGIVSGQSSSCPSGSEAHSLAISYVNLLWTQLRCEGAFIPEVQSTEVLNKKGGICEITFRQKIGALRFFVDSQLAKLPDAGWNLPHDPVSTMSVKVGFLGTWDELTERLCLMSSFTGFVPLPNRVDIEELSFVITAINANRDLLQCGEVVELIGNLERPPARAAVIGRATEVHFSVQVCMRTSSGSCAAGSSELVFASFEKYERWMTDSMTSIPTLRFLGSDPSPCRIGKGSSKVPVEESVWRLQPPRPPQGPLLDIAGNGPPLLEDVQTSDDLQRATIFTRLALAARGWTMLPSKYDFREEYPKCVLPVRRQGICVGAWAMAAVGSFEKQACALSKGSFSARFSVQRILDCAQSDFGTRGCQGNRLEEVFSTIFMEGVASEKCFPYRENKGKDSESNFDLRTPTESLFRPQNFTALLGKGDSDAQACQPLPLKGEDCAPLVFARGLAEAERYVSAYPGAPSGIAVASGERVIQGAILSYGAVAAKIEVYADFLDYTGGIYQRSSSLSEDNLRGVTAVQLLGWGQTQMSKVRKDGNLGGEYIRSHTKYWIGENSFGTEWGEKGYFRWLRGKDHLGIENRAVYGLVQDKFPFDSAERRQIANLQETIEAYEDRLKDQKQASWWLSGSAGLSGLAAVAAIICALRQMCTVDDARIKSRIKSRLPEHEPEAALSLHGSEEDQNARALHVGPATAPQMDACIYRHSDSDNL